MQKKEITNPNENLRIPSWINSDYFKKVLAVDEPQYGKVVTFTPVAAIPPGENFTSAMFRIYMDLEMKDGSVKHKTYILKTMLDDDRGGNFIKETTLFPKELEMYGKYLSAFEKLYKDVGRDVQLAPHCLLSEASGDRINFVFEDLKVQSFVNADRLKGFNMNEMTEALLKLAEFHAVSAVYAEKHGPYPEHYKNGFVEKDKGYEITKDAFMNRLDGFKKAIALWGLPDAEKYIKKFPTFEQYWKCGQRTLDTESNVFNVLNHGDFWCSNIMFTYQLNQEVKDTMIVDYQICKWGSPAEDLLFFIGISAAKDIRVKEYEHFVAIYHEKLVECLKLLKYKGKMPKLRELQMEMYSENTSFYAFFTVFNHLLVVLLPTDKDSSIHTMMKNDEEGRQFRMRALTNPLYVEAMKDMFPFYHNRGLFNFDDYCN